MTNFTNEELEVLRPFGPSIAKAEMPKELVDKLNKYIDDIIADKEKTKKQDWGHKLVGHVKQEFKLENEFIDSSGFMNFLLNKCWIKILKMANYKISCS